MYAIPSTQLHSSPVPSVNHQKSPLFKFRVPARLFNEGDQVSQITYHDDDHHRSSLDYSSSRLCSLAVSCRVLCPWATYSSGAILKLVLTVALEIIILCTCSCRKADADALPLPLLDKRRLVVCTCHCSRNRNSSRTSFPILVVRGYGWFSCFCCCLFLIPLYTY